MTCVPIVSTGVFQKVTQIEEAIKDGVSMFGLARPFVLRPSIVNDYRQVVDVKLTTPRMTTGLP
ncbi:NADH:flavin oxidoreductase, partial [Streptococcus suis]